MPPPATDPQRDLFRGSAHLLVLAVLADSPRYGYAIQKQVQQFTGQTLPHASLYPLLNRLEAQGDLQATTERSTGRPRKWYTLTPQGRATLRQSATAWQADIARYQALVLPAVRRIANHPDGPQKSA